jgi:hypothetical protein
MSISGNWYNVLFEAPKQIWQVDLEIRGTPELFSRDTGM